LNDPLTAHRAPTRRQAALALLPLPALGGCKPRGAEAPAPAPAALADVTAAPRPGDLRVGAMLLPGLIESAQSGPLTDLLRALDEVYTEGRLLISVAPVGRIYEEVHAGRLDFALPSVRLPLNGRPTRPVQVRASTASFGTVSFVLYSRPGQVVTRARIESELAARDFRLRIEAPMLDWGFPVEPFTDFESALRKVAAGRIDAFLWAQEEGDRSLRELGLRDMHRELYAGLQDIYILPPTPASDATDALLSRLTDSLRDSGRLQALYSRIHLPFDPWQPKD
jgi:polar amino acid transport system substrate-binding protein